MTQYVGQEQVGQGVGMGVGFAVALLGIGVALRAGKRAKREIFGPDDYDPWRLGPGYEVNPPVDYSFPRYSRLEQDRKSMLRTRSRSPGAYVH